VTTSAEPPEESPEPSPGKSWRSRVLGPGLSLGLVAVVVIAFAIVLPRIVSYRDVWDALKGMSLAGLGAVVAAAVINLLTYGPSLIAALPGLPFPSAIAVTLASSASTYVAPGGPTVGLGISYVMLRAWGYRRRQITLALSIVTVWGQIVTLSLPLIALTILWLTGGRHPLLERVSQIGSVAFVLLVGLAAFVLYSGAVARWAGDAAAWLANRVLRLIRRGPVTWTGADFAAFRAEAMGLVHRRWLWLTLGTLVGHLGVYLVLEATLLAVGVGLDEVSLAESFAAFALVRLLGSLPFTPGGIGVVEVGLTTALIGFGGNRAEVVAAVLVFRFMTLVVPLVCGGIAGVTWRRYHPGELEAASEEQRLTTTPSD
jgi:uncharacterized membrane protein YbhN (UPF0104 family)